jgi:nucleoside-diphosphate-sugar epimerase
VHHVLVTGANGFIGRALCARMLAEGWRVRGAVRSPARAADLPKGVEIVLIGSISPEIDWSQTFSGVDTVVHLAGRTHVIRERAQDPLAEFRMVNVAGTQSLARSAATLGVQRLIFISSVKVNGEKTGLTLDGKVLMFSEKDSPNPQDAYARSKWEAEQALNRFAAETELDVVIIRPPLVYGPGVEANFRRLIRIVHRGIPMPFGSVKNARSFVYVGNLADAIVTCVRHPKASGKTFLVSDDEEVSTPDLIRRVASDLGRPARLVPFPVSLIRLGSKIIGRTAEADRLLGSLVVDSSKIRRELDWHPPYSMSQGLSETTLWFKSLFQEAKKPTFQVAEYSEEKDDR